MHADVAALLAVQDDDLNIDELESKLAALKPRLQAMAAERDRAVADRNHAAQVAQTEERRRQDVAARVEQHRVLQEKNQAALNTVSSMREATAANAQLEQAKRMIDEDERELSAIGQRVAEANRVLVEREEVVAKLETAQTEARESLSSDQQALEARLAEARATRLQKARHVPRSLLSRYDRIRSRKRERILFPLHGNACGHCDTAIPLQRHSVMAGTGAVEVCEGCGVMLYAAE